MIKIYTLEELLMISLNQQSNHWCRIDHKRYDNDPCFFCLYCRDYGVVINTGSRLYGGAFIDYEYKGSGMKRSESSRYKLSRKWARRYRKYWINLSKAIDPVRRQQLQKDMYAQHLENSFKPTNIVFSGKKIK